MVYPGQFHKLVLIGTLYGDNFNTTLSIVPNALGEILMPPVSDASLASVAGVVGTWFGSTGTVGTPDIIASAKLTSIKLNRLNNMGHYVDPDTKEFTYPTPIAGGASGFLPPQLTMVASLKTALERGRGSKGRMYLPPSIHTVALGTDGRTSTTVAHNVAEAVRSLVNAVNGQYVLIGRVGVASNAGSGRFEHVTRIAAGRVVDTMRSRRNKLAEDYQEVAL